MISQPRTSSDLTSNDLTIGQVAKILEVSVRTLVRWDQSGYLKALRTQTNRRYYKKAQIIEFAAARK